MKSEMGIYADVYIYQIRMGHDNCYLFISLSTMKLSISFKRLGVSIVNEKTALKIEKNKRNHVPTTSNINFILHVQHSLSISHAITRGERIWWKDCQEIYERHLARVNTSRNLSV
jgi:hypothetical protein